MRIDVSEIKTRRECQRKWALSSRNYYHLKPKVDNPNLNFGTVFHEALAGLYLSRGVPEKVDEVINKHVESLPDAEQQRMLMCMLTGYAEKVLPEDLQKYKVLDVEWHFKFKPFEVYKDYMRNYAPEWGEQIEACGSIDLILLDLSTNQIVGFEHKTCKNFRSLFYNAMDEQPRMYYLALDQYVNEYNQRNKTDYTNGGVYVNEVRKLKTRFEWNRLDPIMYSTEECAKFIKGFMTTAKLIYAAKHTSSCREKKLPLKLPDPEPGYMKCQMCDYQTVCAHYRYNSATKDSILEEFVEEYEEREFDHLDEKVQRSGETSDAVPVTN